MKACFHFIKKIFTAVLLTATVAASAHKTAKNKPNDYNWLMKLTVRSEQSC
jgi:hypothetical protein